MKRNVNRRLGLRDKAGNRRPDRGRELGGGYISPAGGGFPAALAPFIVRCIVVCFAGLSWAARADEIIIDSRMGQPIELGGISWSPKYGFSGNVLELQATTSGLSPSQSCELTAGELYKFFKNQGLHSVDHLVVVVSVPNTTAGDRLVVQGLQLLVNDESASDGSPIVLAGSTSEHRIIIPGGQSISGRAEAKLTIPLGFDFMTRYSENSSERLVLNYKIDGGSTSEMPVFMFEGRTTFARWPTYAWVAVFIGFWLFLFWILRVITFVRPRQPTLAKSGGETESPPWGARTSAHGSLAKGHSVARPAGTTTVTSMGEVGGADRISGKANQSLMNSLGS